MPLSNYLCSLAVEPLPLAAKCAGLGHSRGCLIQRCSFCCRLQRWQTGLTCFEKQPSQVVDCEAPLPPPQCGRCRLRARLPGLNRVQVQAVLQHQVCLHQLFVAARFSQLEQPSRVPVSTLHPACLHCVIVSLFPSRCSAVRQSTVRQTTNGISRPKGFSPACCSSQQLGQAAGLNAGYIP